MLFFFSASMSDDSSLLTVNKLFICSWRSFLVSFFKHFRFFFSFFISANLSCVCVLFWFWASISVSRVVLVFFSASMSDDSSLLTVNKLFICSWRSFLVSFFKHFRFFFSFFISANLSCVCVLFWFWASISVSRVVLVFFSASMSDDSSLLTVNKLFICSWRSLSVRFCKHFSFFFSFSASSNLFCVSVFIWFWASISVSRFALAFFSASWSDESFLLIFNRRCTCSLRFLAFWFRESSSSLRSSAFILRSSLFAVLSLSSSCWMFPFADSCLLYLNSFLNILSTQKLLTEMIKLNIEIPCPNVLLVLSTMAK
ncbi:uncharacterized protein LOC121642617 [Melanotaenia boesemani]|uniref:uncharacterized protein LOC121642617 n=1 Tax=Melanotaenia boesemani TaxID=1250792 RepID=UPI001C058AC4|nr:uncharacterized protein LOC121642617 [Melanotaenia boesemani]XP_041845322.1 uncharacterized protein LOC121642617 [Melanotaenia boesemani]XP_041845323.1 uncharacterized protein LOC121642617 [Melanotaenia boesemani]XP_041845324.1 uncharacterized protein LOC121642617 [Melanotaenia boesemani]XP_041845325.1 uncharacterized protein LOC121642617 [Melanotaenia boesemani]XP_041845326.1 uncharacterized protein LOC121642617 [Melanotaenia boesemani]XP_041845327.1 uncharacterized protein LOC121642617 [